MTVILAHKPYNTNSEQFCALCRVLLYSQYGALLKEV